MSVYSRPKAEIRAKAEGRKRGLRTAPGLCSSLYAEPQPQAKARNVGTCTRGSLILARNVEKLSKYVEKLSKYVTYLLSFST